MMQDTLQPHTRSLTPLVAQVRWKVPTEFPACPAEFTDDALLLYASRLSFGAVFARSPYYTSLIVDHRLNEDELIVLTRFADDTIKHWAVAKIWIDDGLFYHRSEFTFFSLRGALKHFCDLTAEELTDSIDDYC